VERIRARIASDGDLTRTELSREVCRWMEWRSPAGRLQEMSCRLALRELERRGVVELPAPRCPSRRSMPVQRFELEDDQAPLRCTLADLGEVRLVPVHGDAESSELWNLLISAHHYLGYTPLVGAQRRYLIDSENQGYLGAIGFSAAARRLAARDRWIGWNDRQRARGLQQIVCNSRFLILPWVQVKNLASHVLARTEKVVLEDWQCVYGYQPVLLETYVDPEHYRATCYKAANWVNVGRSSGRGRQDRKRSAVRRPKDVYLRPLQPGWREVLCARSEQDAHIARATTAGADPAEADRDWAEAEFGAARLGDCRRTRRLVQIGRAFYARPQANIPEACATVAATRAAYRFFGNDKVTLDGILEPHRAETVRRMGEESVVLAVQDTTSLNYSAHPATGGLGSIGTRSGGAVGLIVHDTIAVAAGGLPLGVLDAQVWVRPEKTAEELERERKRPIEQKESAKWLRSYEVACRAQAELGEATRVISTGDREADLYELFVMARDREGGADLLVRAEHNRRTQAEGGHLWEEVHKSRLRGSFEVAVEARGKRAARLAKLDVRFAPVTLRPPQGKAKLGKVKLWAVQARERRVPGGGAKRLEWMVLTTVAVEDFEDARRVLGWYEKRWQIEIFHRTFKSGCRIEERQFGDADSIQACLAVDMVVAWRVHHLVWLARADPEQPCTRYFTEEEWRALYVFVHRRFPPEDTAMSMREATRMVGGLGGFLGRKCDGEPGAQVLWIGLQRLDDITVQFGATKEAFAAAGARPP